MPLNPWLVDSIEAFSFYCCPECVFRSKEENFFQAHALQNHVLSKSFFLENNSKETSEAVIDVKLELVQDPDPDISKVKQEHDLKLDSNDFTDPLEVVIPILSSTPQTKSKKNVKISKKFQCQECGKQCKTGKQFEDHRLYHKSLEQISCVQCNETITRKFLKKHLKSVHDMEIDKNATWIQGNVKEFQCEDCGRQCNNQKQYSNHKYYHKYVLDGPQTICVKCDLEVPAKLFERHIKRVHDKNKMF